MGDRNRIHTRVDIHNHNPFFVVAVAAAVVGVVGVVVVEEDV